jgi:hypothetical protein
MSSPCDEMGGRDTSQNVLVIVTISLSDAEGSFYSINPNSSSTMMKAAIVKPVEKLNRGDPSED